MDGVDRVDGTLSMDMKSAVPDFRRSVTNAMSGPVNLNDFQNVWEAMARTHWRITTKSRSVMTE